MHVRILVVAAVAAAVVPATAAAQPYEPETDSLPVSDTTVVLGQGVTLSGSGYADNSTIVMTIESEPRTLGTTRADSDGTFSATVEIPTDIAPGPHTLKATGRAPDGATRVLATTITVLGEAEPGSLPFTGSSVWVYGLTGLFLIAIGAVLVHRRKVRAGSSLG